DNPRFFAKRIGRRKFYETNAENFNNLFDQSQIRKFELSKL
ncbi:MAG: hypothetical protein AVDCRST_MAG74-2831, partial [uncultured Pyrinomonadaceae bacterium]